MLKKLLKYDLINIYKFLIIFYSLAIFFGILTRIFFSIENSFILNIIGQICSGAAISMMFSILINNFMRLWVRFKQNLYGDESYLTHTLPIEKKTLYLSKIITAIITLFTSVLVVALTLFIAYYSKDSIELIKGMLLPLANAYNNKVIIILFLLLFVLYLQFMNMLQCGLIGIILGHKKNNTKTLYSVLFGFGVYLVSQTIILIIIFLMALFNKDIMNLMYTNEMISLSSTKLIVYISIIIYTVILFIEYIIGIKLLNKGVNVD
ncbi:MAG: hypothetical protein E7166_04700 [Firmicutes bacterium]|nr:hypothetical protein [Bacillota bacterium]